MEHVLHVFVLFEFVEEFLDGCTLFVGHFLEIVGYAFELGRNDLVTVVLKIFLDVGVVLESTIKYDFLFVGLYFINATVDKLKLKFLDVETFGGFDLEHTLVVEKERERTLSSERTIVFVEIRTDVGNGTGVVVGSSLHEDGDTERSVAFVGYFLVVAGILVGSLLDGAFNGVLGHVGSLGVLHQGAQTRITVGIGTAGLSGYGDFLTDARECARHVAPAFELTGFTIFKCSSHE